MKIDSSYIFTMALLCLTTVYASDRSTVGKKFIFRDTICDINFEQAEKKINLPYSTINPGYELKILLRYAEIEVKNKEPFSDISCILYFSANQLKENYNLQHAISSKTGDLNVKEDFVKLKETLRLNPFYQKKYQALMSDKDIANAMEIKDEE